MNAGRDLDDVIDQSVHAYRTLPEARRQANYWQDVNCNTAGHRIVRAVTTYTVLETTPAVKHAVKWGV